MSDQKTPAKYSMIGFGLFTVVMGLIPILSALDIIPTDPSSFHAPRWVVILAGMVFVVAGIPVTLVDPLFNDYREAWWFTYLSYLGSFGILLSMLVILNWVAFGPGERRFSGGFSLPFISFWSDSVSEWSGRAVFGMFALCMNGVILYGVVSTVWKNITGHLDD